MNELNIVICSECKAEYSLNGGNTCPRCDASYQKRTKIKADENGIGQQNATERSINESAFLALMKMYAPDLPLPDLEQLYLPIAEIETYPFDFGYAGQKIIIEIDGGSKMRNGGHNTGERFRRDRLKQNLATLAGWRVIRFTDVDLKIHQPYIIEFMQRILGD